MPTDENVLGHVFGGSILVLLDKVAGVCAVRHSRSPCVTASFDRVDFREPILVGELVHLKGSVNFVGRSSMEIGVRVEAENMLTGVLRHTNSCYVTFVAIDNDGRPVEVPALVPETDEEKRRFAAGAERRRLRLIQNGAEVARRGSEP